MHYYEHIDNMYSGLEGEVGMFKQGTTIQIKWGVANCYKHGMEFYTVRQFARQSDVSNGTAYKFWDLCQDCNHGNIVYHSEFAYRVYAIVKGGVKLFAIVREEIVNVT